MVLQGLKQNELDDFRMDFSEMLRIYKWLNRKYSQSIKTFDFYMPKFKSLVGLFNKKYRKLSLEIIIEPHKADFRLAVFIKSSSVKHVFSDCASKISGISGIGTESFDEASITDPAGFSDKAKSIEHMAYLSYFNNNRGENSFLVMDDKKREAVEVICPVDEFLSGPAFDLCAFYAIDSANWKIDVYSKASEFGFVDEMTDLEKREWDKNFPAYFGE